MKKYTGRLWNTRLKWKKDACRMLAPVSRCPSLPCSWLKGTKLCTIFGHHASNYATILGRVRREQTGGDGRRGLVVARSGVGGGRVWARLAPGSGRVAQPPWSRHHPVLTSGTWAHPHNHWFHDMWRSSLFFVTLKVPIINNLLRRTGI